MYGLYSRVDGESYNKRPKYRRDSYRGHFDLFYSDSDSSYLDWVVGGTWAITKRYDEDEYSAPHLDWLAHGERSRVGVISFVQFATCPHHATRFCESQVPGVAGNGYVLRNISMQEISLPTPAPKPFAEIAAEWLRGNYFCIFLPFFPFLVMGVWFWLLHFEMIVMFTRILMGKAISPAQTKVEQTLEEIKQVLESPDRLPTFCENPRSLESLESSVTETIAEKQELLHYYKQKDDQVFRFAAIPLQVGSICLNVYMWVCLAYIVFENVSGLRDELYGRSFSSGGDIHWLTVFAFWLSYVMVLIESFCTFPQEIRDVREVQQARTVIDRMLRLEPLLRMQACQDHLETRPLPLHQFIPLRHWRDLSVGDVLGASNRGVTRLFVESIICAGDKRTLEIIDSRYAQFEEEHHAFVKCELPAFQKRLIICDNNPPWWMNRKVFYLASFLGLTWIYRFCLKMMTSSSTLVLVKQVFVDDTDTSEAWGHLCWPGWAKHLVQERVSHLKPWQKFGLQSHPAYHMEQTCWTCWMYRIDGKKYSVDVKHGAPLPPFAIIFSRTKTCESDQGWEIKRHVLPIFFGAVSIASIFCKEVFWIFGCWNDETF